MSTIHHITAESRPNHASVLSRGCQYPIRALTSIISIGNGSAHATKVPGLIFLSGQVPADKSGKIVDGGIREHTAQCISNLGEVLEAAGSSWEKVVKVNVYLKDMDNFGEMNEVYEKLLPTPKPARTCVQVAKLPLDVDIEIEAIATY